MLLILIALIALAVLAVVLLVVADNIDNTFIFVLGALAVCGAAIGLFAYAFTGWDYFAAEYKADIINREYGTTYTQAEVYWASDVINTVRELDRKRIELNGDLLENKQ